MKRSEMLNLVMEVLNNHQNNTLVPIDFTDSLACEIVCCVEEAGMLPPAVNPYKMNFELEDFEWEPEDELS
jgi:hypothetical protein